MHKGDTNHVVHNDTTCFHTRCPHEFASINPWRKHLLTQPMCLKYFAKLSMLMPSSIRSEWTQTTLLCYKDIWQTMDMDIDGMCFEGTNGWTKFHSRFRVNERATMKEQPNRSYKAFKDAQMVLLAMVGSIFLNRWAMKRSCGFDGW